MSHNKRMKLTGAAILVSRGVKLLQRPRQLILIVELNRCAVVCSLFWGFGVAN
jgi:hypothetical protein